MVLTLSISSHGYLSDTLKERSDESLLGSCLLALSLLFVLFFHTCTLTTL